MTWLVLPDRSLDRPAVFSDTAIQFCLAIKVLFKLPLRRTTGMVASLLKMANLDWAVPDYTTLCRRQKTLAVQIPYRRANSPLNLLVDSTGIKFLGDGEWQPRKPGVQGRRQWRKVHLAMVTALPTSGRWCSRPAATVTAPFCQSCWTKSPKARRSARSRPTVRMTPAVATRPSTARQCVFTCVRGIEAKPLMTLQHHALPGSGCGASRRLANASPQETQTARPPRSRSASHL